MKIEERLRKLFSDRSIYEKRVIVFWIDEKEDFKEDFESIEIENVKKLVLDEENMFEVKVLLEYKDTDSDYLIYTCLDMESENNWLLGTYLKSKKFRADFVSLVMEEFSIPHHLRELVKEGVDFFKDNVRLEKLKRLKGIEELEDEEELIKVILSVEASLDHVDLEPAFGKVLEKLLNGSKVKAEKLFWKISKKLEYSGKGDPKTLSKFLLLSDFLIDAPDSLKAKFKSFRPSNSAANLVRIWRSSNKEGFSKVCEIVENELRIKNIISELGIGDLAKLDTFKAVDEVLIERIADVIESGTVKKEFLELIEKRLETFWGRKMKDEYLALENSIRLLLEDFLPVKIDSLDDGIMLYAERIFRMDQFYRKFHYHSSRSRTEALKGIVPVVERKYSELSSRLDEMWHPVLKRIEKWGAKHILLQWRFFTRKVMMLQRKSILIFSDALRYEIAHELSREIKDAGFKVEIIPMLGVVPSYTQLGMAALLYKEGKIDIDESGVVFVDGLNTSGIDGRKKLLEKNGLKAEFFDFEDFKKLSKVEMREKLKGVRLAVIYHNTIDRTGDDPKSEGRVFEAAQDAIDELSQLVKRIFDNLGVSEVYIIADHGFIYQEEPLERWKEIESPTVKTIFKKRRFVISKEKMNIEGFYMMRLSYIGSDAFVYIPHGLTRIKVQGGGSRFVHGGASLQEIVVPCVRVLRTRERKSRIEGIEIGKIDEIPTSVFTLKVFREATSQSGFDVLAYVEDALGNIISDVKTIRLRKEDLIYKVTLTLKRAEYDKEATYHIVIEDPERKEKKKFDVKVNILFFDEFDL